MFEVSVVTKVSTSFAFIVAVTTGAVPPANLYSGANDRVPAAVALLVTVRVIVCPEVIFATSRCVSVAFCKVRVKKLPLWKSIDAVLLVILNAVTPPFTCPLKVLLPVKV